ASRPGRPNGSVPALEFAIPSASATISSSEPESPWSSPSTPVVLILRMRFGRGFVGAERVGTERIACIGKGASPRTAADMAVLACAALAVELIGRVQTLEDLGVAVDLHQRVHTHIAAAQWQEPGRIDFAKV